MTSNETTKISQLISDRKKTVLITHANPDGDAVGSLLSMFAYLKKKEVEVEAILPDTIPSFYRWLECSDCACTADRDRKKCEVLLENAELIFCLDFNAFGRAGDLESKLKNSSAIKVLVDHHPEPSAGFDYIISDTTVSSTAELVYRLIEALGDKKLVDKPIAEAIYTGIMTDTGSFNFNSENPEMYEVIRFLVEKGVEPALIHQRVYDTFSESRMRLIGHCLLNKMVVMKDSHAAYIALSRKDMNDYNYRKGDTEGLVNYPLAIDGVVFAALFTEQDNLIKASFRSKGDFKANEFSLDHFHGGGHKNAAGGKSFKSLEETIEEFEKLVSKKYKTRLQDAKKKI
ncbi:MAG: DHH family phosphoesterase [Bacteroidota bacterium]